MKKLIMIVSVVLAAAACSKTAEVASVKDASPKGDVAVSFSAYTPRVTKADLDLAALKAGTGFGVFAYYTDNLFYDQSYLPNFMYNEQVTWDTDHWEYAPVKYWPNEYGASAISDDVDKLTFFAYAPYVAVTPTTGVPTFPTSAGIMAISRNYAEGDPLVKYKADLVPGNYVDLCWGVAESADISAWTIKETGAAQTNFTAGCPWIDVQRPEDATAQALKFNFKHALAKLNVQIDAYVDGPDGTNALAAGSKIYVRSISLSGFALEGALNLNNFAASTPFWMNYDGKHELQLDNKDIVIYDGRKDGKEGYNISAPNEKPVGLNPDIVQAFAATPGVINTAVNLFNSATAGEYIAVIPTGDPVDVTIVYDVETEDASLAGYLSNGTTHGSSIENVITKKAVFAALENGKEYILKLHLGMNSVKFDADVAAWTAEGDEDVDLPEN